MSKYDKELDTRTREYDEAAKPLQGDRDLKREQELADETNRDEPVHPVPEE